MLVCPASNAVIRCQLSTTSKVCASGNRLWIQNHCGGVSFVD